jgi:outer membrane protein TolC
MRASRIIGAASGLVGVLLSPHSAAAGHGAAAGDTVRLSLAAVLQRVQSEHPVSRAAAAAVRAAGARAAQLRRYANPAFEIEHATFSEVDNVALLQPIRWPWESAALGGLGAAEVTAAAAGAEVERRSLALDAAQRFVKVLRDERARALAVEAESLANSAVERTVAARNLGQVGDLALLQAQVSLDAARRSRVGAESELQASRAVLALTLGLEVDTPLVLEGDLASLAPLTAPESAFGIARVTDPESSRLEAEATRAEQEARLAQARRWPGLTLGPATNLGGAMKLGLSVGLGIPLWDRQGAAIRAATADREAALARRDARQRELASLLLEAWSTLTRTNRELTLLRSGELARAEQAVALAARAIQTGGPYVTAWLTARQAYLDAQRAELDLEREAAGARLVLRHLAGTLRAGDLR